MNILEELMAVTRSKVIDELYSRGQSVQVPSEIWTLKGVDYACKAIWCFLLSRDPQWPCSLNNLCKELEISKQTAAKHIEQMHQFNMMEVSEGDNRSLRIELLGPSKWNIGGEKCYHSVVKNVTTVDQNLPPSQEESREREKLSLDDIYRRWLASLPERGEYSAVQDELRSLMETIKDNGYSASDLGSNYKKKVLSRWAHSKYPKKQEDAWDRILGEVLLLDVTLSDAVDRTPKAKKPKGKPGEVDIDYAIRITTDDDEIARMMEEYQRVRSGGNEDER
jgi:hypothetical protein